MTIPLTLNIDNQNRVVGIKEFSNLTDECVGVEHGGLGTVILEGNSVIIGNDTNPVSTIPLIVLDSDDSLKITNTSSFISSENIKLEIDPTKIDIGNILSNSNKLLVNRIGSWVPNMLGFEDADDRLFDHTTSDTGSF